MNVDHYELRAAFEQFLEAKRSLRQAYRRFVESHPAGLLPALEAGAFGQAGNDPATIEDFRELKDENEALRKSLTLLHAHSLSIQGRLDALLGNRDERLDAVEAVASRVREDPRTDQPLDGALSELTDGPDRWTTLTASAGPDGRRRNAVGNPAVLRRGLLTPIPPVRSGWCR